MTVQEFHKCASKFGYGTPPEIIANAFISQAKSKGNITSRLEAFMAVAQMSWESWGFTARSEFKCSGGRWLPMPCDTYSSAGCPPCKKYYGRGFLQITHCSEYKEASVDFPGIVENPDIVAADDRIAMGTAFWFWKKHMHNAPGVQQGQFGSATRALNGNWECTPNGPEIYKAQKRWSLFKQCLQAAGATDLHPKEDGCYGIDYTTPNPEHPVTTPTIVPFTPYPNLHKCHNNINDTRCDIWCIQNCQIGNCPNNVCKCDE